MAATYPEWVYYPNDAPPPEWAREFLEVVSSQKEVIDSRLATGLSSNAVLARLRPDLEALGYQVEASKLRTDRIRRPVLFGDYGRERVAYEVDAVHDEIGIVVEVEAGRGADGNAVYRDLIRSSLIVGARYLALGVLQEYHRKSKGRSIVVASYKEARNQLDAIYASGRLQLPFDGILLFGY